MSKKPHLSAEKVIETAVAKESDTIILADLDLTEIPTSLARTSRFLCRMALSGNRLRSLPEEMGLLVNLKYLNLKGNLFRELPSVILRIASLEVLDVSRNKIEKIPKEINGLRNLKVLSISRNQIRVIPRVICDLTCLKLLKIASNPITFPPPNIMSKFDESEEALKDLIDYIGQQPIAMDVDLTESSGIQNGGKQEQKIIQKCRHCALKIMEHLTAANSAINIVPFQLLEDIRGEIANVFEPDQSVNFHGFQKFKLLALEILKLSKQLGSYSLEHTKSTSSSDTLILLCTNFYVANVYLKFLFKEIVFFAKENCLSSHGDQSFDQDLINFIVEVATRASQLLTELEKSQNSSPELSAAIQKVDKYITRVIRSRDMLSENQSRDLSKKIASDAANYISSFVQMFEIFKDVSKKHSFDKSILNSLHQCHSDNKSLAQMLSRASK